MQRIGTGSRESASYSKSNQKPLGGFQQRVTGSAFEGHSGCCVENRLSGTEGMGRLLNALRWEMGTFMWRSLDRGMGAGNQPSLSVRGALGHDSIIVLLQGLGQALRPGTLNPKPLPLHQ